jgi:hypothetical protein
VPSDRIDAVLEAWYRFLGSNPVLFSYFTRTPGDQHDAIVLAAIRGRFGRWLSGAASPGSGDKTLEYELETAEGWTDGSDITENTILKYVLALLYPITTQQKMHQAWVNSTLLQNLRRLSAGQAPEKHRKDGDVSVRTFAGYGQRGGSSCAKSRQHALLTP